MSNSALSGNIPGIVVPGTSSGLVSLNGLTGNTTGNAIASGYVGEVLSATVSSATSTGATGVYFDAVTLPLIAGTWEITGYYRLIKNTAVFSFIKQELALITATGNSVTGGVDNVNYQVMTDGGLATAFTSNAFALPNVRVYCDGTNITVAGSTTSGTTLRLKALTYNYTSGQPQYTAAIKAVRIA